MKKEIISVDFVDFWPNFIKTDNYFYHLLCQEFEVIITDNKPDILFHSVDYFNEKNHLKYNNEKTKKVFYTGENQPANYNDSHFSFTFENNEDERNYRLPLWALHLNWFEVPYNEDRDQSYLYSVDKFLKKDLSNLKDKKWFCSFVATQPKGKRVDFIPKLMSKKDVHCGGGLYNNIGGLLDGRGDQENKINFLNYFKFNISFEKTSNCGYVTEKIIQPMFTNTIPIYWGAVDVIKDFNVKSFINAHDFESDDELIDYILEIDSNQKLYEEILVEPWFKNNQIPDFVKPNNVLKFFKDEILK
jgi:hypothetical protein